MNLLVNAIVIRKACINDASKLSDFIKKLDSENEYLLYDKDERDSSVSFSEKFIDRMNESYPSIIFIAVNPEQNVVGFVCGEVSRLRRFRHVMKVNIGILKEYYNLGLGKVLADKLQTHANEESISRIEASVVSRNQASLNLCTKFGLEIEGIKKHAIKINELYFDEIMLSKILL